MNQPTEGELRECPFHAECRVYEHKGFVRHELPYGLPCPIAYQMIPVDKWNHRAPSKAWFARDALAKTELSAQAAEIERLKQELELARCSNQQPPLKNEMQGKI